MAILPLVQLKREKFSAKDTPLRSHARKVDDFGPDFQQKVRDLIDTVKAHDIAVGLAAPQVNIPLAVAVIQLEKELGDDILVLVNPEIVSTSGKKDRMKESCMSLPDYRGNVTRRYKLTVKYQDASGEQKALDAQGFLARVIAHEVDHLDGVLYVDRMDRGESLEKVDFFQ